MDIVRKYFNQKGFIETPTPSLVTCPGMESEIEPFSTSLSIGKRKERFFLPTSPELHLKRLLSQGWTEIFEIRQCFRNEELSPHHQPEFTMLEWYRAYDSLSSIVLDVKALIAHLQSESYIYGSIGEFKQSSLAELFLKFTPLKLSPSTTREELAEYCRQINYSPREDDSWNDLFHVIFINKIEAHLGKEGPEIIYDFPASQAALAQVGSENWSQRLEVYWRGFEIGNAFNELLDPLENRKRFRHEMRLRKEKGRTEVPIDEEFMSALEWGLPPCAGIALGLERLFLACQNLHNLEDLRLFPLS